MDIKSILEEITEVDVTEIMAPLPKIKGRDVRTYFIIRKESDLKNIVMNVIRKFSKTHDIYYMKKEYAIGVFVVEKK